MVRNKLDNKRRGEEKGEREMILPAFGLEVCSMETYIDDQMNK
jgi:hypothetical protein